MRGDIVPPPRQKTPVVRRSDQPQVAPTVEQPVAMETDQPKDHTASEPAESSKLPVVAQPSENILQNQDTADTRKNVTPRSKVLIGIIGVIGVIVIAAIAVFIWYTQQLSSVKPGSEEKVKIVIEPGSGPAAIASVLKKNGLIKNEAAFNWYVRLEGKAGSLQSGSYRIGPGDNVPAIVKHLTSGATDTFSLTFLPGATLSKHRQVLIDAGYSAEEVDAALAKTYDLPLFEGKPEGTTLEGYIYGETYNFTADTSPEDILKRTFEQYDAVIKKENLKDAYAQRGFSLYQGITLASIIQREVASPADAAQVAQVFELRLQMDMPLGSDVTYQYIADKTGQARSVDLDSPYNTRRYKGLPPGPIASPGVDALKSVAYPAPGDFVYFLSGDDDKTYFARTNEEHEANIQNHCQKKCQII